VVGLSCELDNTAIVAKGGISKNSAEQVQPLVGESAASK
jgi:hypothetical protein